MKNSAVEFIVQKLAKNGILHSSDICEAKKMEKQREKDAYLRGIKDFASTFK